MKTVNAAVTAAIRSSNDVTALPRLVATWNMNRYVSATVTNTPSESTNGNDVEIFPIESIIEPIRPTKGINKARVNQAVIGDNYIDPNMPRFYVSSVDDKYKYWQGPNLSSGTGAITGVLPTVMYASATNVNKIVIKLENSWASPTAWTVETTSDGTTWTTAATNPTIANDGSVTLYWNGTGWSSTKPADLTPMRSVRGIRLSVTQLGAGRTRTGAVMWYRKNGVRTNTTGANSYFSLIELGVQREVDLTSYLISVSDTFDMSDVSMLYPIGTLTTNTADITLWNGDNDFSTDNAASPFAGLLESNVEMNLEYIYNINGTKYTVQQFKMYTNGPWAGQKNATVTVPLGDFSIYFQNNNPNPAMYENLTLPDIIYRLCDSMGFVDYNYIANDDLVQYTIPVYYVTGERTFWEELDELAKATQSAIFFGSFGRMQIRTRESAFPKNSTPVWTLRGEKSGTELADIVLDGLTQEEEFQTNLVKVSYQTTAWSDWNNGLPTMQSVWEPEGTEALRACPLAGSLTTALPVDGTPMFFRIPPEDAKIFPYYGLVNIESEIIKFEGKRFFYYTDTKDANGNVTAEANVRKVAIVKSHDEFKKYNELVSAGHRFKNYFDGNIQIIERGMWNSDVAAHNVEASGYSLHGYIAGAQGTRTGGFVHNKADSTVTMGDLARIKSNSDYLLATRGAGDDQPFLRYGYKFKFEKGAAYTSQAAGLVINNATGTSPEEGYFIEFVPTNKLSLANRAQRNELAFYSRVGGKNTILGGEGNRGAALAIIEGVEYEVDVLARVNGAGNHEIYIWVNGMLAISVVVGGTNRRTMNGRFGLFTRGVSRVTFEYLYAIKRVTPDLPDDFSYFDKVKGGYVGGAFEREWVYGWKTYNRRIKRKTVKGNSRWSQQFMDEFGPIVHELREYDVTFEPSPVLHSRLFSTNDWASVCTEYRATPFGAKFVMANTSRKNAVINGPETIQYAGSNKEVNHVLSVIGRALVVAEAATVEVRNEAQIRARGEIEATLDSQWIQSEASAKAIGEWIKQHWSTGVDGLSVNIFGNPLIEVGDTVAIEYPEKNMSAATARYYVTGASTSFETGLSTTLTLRRIGSTV